MFWFVNLFKRFQKLADAKPTVEAFYPRIDNLILPHNPHYDIRKLWGNRPTTMINKIIVHQSLSDSTTEQVNRYHTSKESHIKPGVGCPKICYHYTIEKDGTIYKVNKDTDITWHTAGQNMTSLGVLVLGNFSGEGYVGKSFPTDRQLTSLTYLLDKLRLSYKLTKNDVYGHHDFGKPACPGYDIKKHLEEYKKLSIRT